MRKAFLTSVQNFWQTRRPEIIAGVLCLSTVLALGRVLIRRHLYIESSNAIFGAYFTPLGAEVGGEVTRVLVSENQRVARGQILCLLDERPQLYALRKSIAERDAVIARSEIADRDLQRAKTLRRGRVIAPVDYDQAATLSQSTRAEVTAAAARVTQAQADWERTRVRAPAEGVIAFRTASAGRVVQAGTPLFGFVSDGERWVTAKVRETDLVGMHIGDDVEVTLDSEPRRKFKGHLESIAPASEARFAAVPDDFSAGNFTKYVQWVPIRVRVEMNDEDRQRIPVGVSSEIHLRRRS